MNPIEFLPLVLMFFVGLIVFQKNPLLKKISIWGLAVSSILLLLFFLYIDSTKPSKKEQATKVAFAANCQSLKPISQLSTVLGQNRIDALCSCAYDETLKVVTKSEMEIALSPGAGMIDTEVAKLSQYLQLAVASCLQNLDVPSNAKEITSSTAAAIKAQVEVQKAMSKSISK